MQFHYKRESISYESLIKSDKNALVMEAKFGERKAQLYIDQENFLLLKEVEEGFRAKAKTPPQGKRE